MKKGILLLLTFILFGCSKSKEEQMFYNYQNNISLKNINVDLKDTDFKVLSIKKIGIIKYKDSIDYFQSILELEEEIPNNIFLVKKLKNKIKTYTILNNSSEILSVKYKATHSITNPLLTVKQTFTRYYYSNSENTKIIKSESVK